MKIGKVAKQRGSATNGEIHPARWRDRHPSLHTGRAHAFHGS
jgi:hypothetical protein